MEALARFSVEQKTFGKQIWVKRLQAGHDFSLQDDWQKAECP